MLCGSPPFNTITPYRLNEAIENICDPFFYIPLYLWWYSSLYAFANWTVIITIVLFYYFFHSWCFFSYLTNKMKMCDMCFPFWGQYMVSVCLVSTNLCIIHSFTVCYGYIFHFHCSMYIDLLFFFSSHDANFLRADTQLARLVHTLTCPNLLLYRITWAPLWKFPSPPSCRHYHNNQQHKRLRWFT